MQRNVFLLALMCLLPATAFASPTVTSVIPNAKIVGQGRLSMAFWDVYDATLFAPSGKLTNEQPFALSIQYMREINGKDIADRSVIEIRKQGFSDETKLAKWNARLKDIFPNVQDGTVLLAIFIPGKETRFYEAEKQIGVIEDADFTQWFADIWLSEKTSEPDLRRKLLGLS